MKILWPLPLVLLILAALPAWGQDARQQALLEAVRANPKDANAHFNLGVSYFNQQDYRRASDSFKKCVGLNSRDDQAKELLESSLGIADYQDGKFSSAADHFRKTLKINPKNPNANLLLGDSYLQMNQHAKAEEALKDYAAAFPSDRSVQAKAHEGLGKIYFGWRRPIPRTIPRTRTWDTRISS
jgi:tetratricopeptide (TPR) repeat protein